jgi:SET domain-containing protein
MELGNKDVIVKKSRNGRGVFAKRNFLAGETLFEIKGKLITCYEDENIDEETRSNTIRFNTDYFLSPKGNFGNFTNHSCNPNSRLVKRVGKLFIIAITDIRKGEEVTFDYSTVLASDDIWRMNCKCKEKNCRKVIKKFNTLPAKIKKDYISRKIVPKYILNI